MITPEQAIDLFIERFPDTGAEILFDYGKCYFISNATSGDFVNDDYIIDKNTGDISEIEFDEWMDMAKKIDDEDVIEYRISEMIMKKAS